MERLPYSPSHCAIRALAEERRLAPLDGRGLLAYVTELAARYGQQRKDTP